MTSAPSRFRTVRVSDPRFERDGPRRFADSLRFLSGLL